jgi:predicted DNA-binding WGR domain protein
VSYLRLARLDPVQQRQRFYALIWQPSLVDEGALLRSWGWVGARGRTVVARYADRDTAQPVIQRLIQRQLRQGYRVVEWI